MAVEVSAQFFLYLPQYIVLLNHKGVKYTQHFECFPSKVLRILNTFIVFAKSVAYMKQILLNRQGYSDRIERVFGNTNIDGIKHLHLRDFLKKQEL